MAKIWVYVTRELGGPTATAPTYFQRGRMRMFQSGTMAKSWCDLFLMASRKSGLHLLYCRGAGWIYVLPTFCPSRHGVKTAVVPELPGKQKVTRLSRRCLLTLESNRDWGKMSFWWANTMTCSTWMFFSSQVSFEDWLKINGYNCRLGARRVTTPTDHHYYPMRPDIEEESK